MAGMSIKVGGFGGVRTQSQANYAGGSGPTSATAAAFGPGSSQPAQSDVSTLAPNDAFGISFWLGVIGLAGLVFIRHSLPR